MHFRSQGSAVQLVRSVYDAEKKRAKYQIVGKLSKRTLAAPDEVLAQLTPEEKTELDTFVENYRNSTALQAKVYAFQLSDIVQQVLGAVDALTPAERDLVLANLSQAALDIRRFLNRKDLAEAA